MADSVEELFGQETKKFKLFEHWMKRCSRAAGIDFEAFAQSFRLQPRELYVRSEAETVVRY